MISADMKLKKVSDTIFQETPVPDDGSRALEWRRAFNCVSLPLKNIELITEVHTHDAEFDLKDEFKESPNKLITPDIRTIIAIKGFVDEEETRDYLYCAVQDKEDEALFTFERPAGDIEVTIQLREPNKDDKKIHDGVFYGNCVRIDYDENDFIIFDLGVPKSQIDILISHLRFDPSATIHLTVELLSYSFEVDDSFRDVYHPRDLFIYNAAPAFVSRIWLASKINTQTMGKSSDDDGEFDAPVNLTPAQVSHQELIQSLSDLKKLIGKIGLVIGLLVIVVMISTDKILDKL